MAFYYYHYTTISPLSSLLIYDDDFILTVVVIVYVLRCMCFGLIRNVHWTHQFCFAIQIVPCPRFIFLLPCTSTAKAKTHPWTTCTTCWIVVVHFVFFYGNFLLFYSLAKLSLIVSPYHCVATQSVAKSNRSLGLINLDANTILFFSRSLFHQNALSLTFKRFNAV